MKNRPDINSSVINTIEILGDKWTIFILREAFIGVKTFEKFQANLGIATNILSSRLKNLVSNGIFDRQKNPADGRRFFYKLTEKGLDLYPIILTLMNWGDRWLAGKADPPMLLCHNNCNKKLKITINCANCGDIVRAQDVTFKVVKPRKTKS